LYFLFLVLLAARVFNWVWQVVKIYTEPLSIYWLKRVIIPRDKVRAILLSRGERVVSVSNDKMWFFSDRNGMPELHSAVIDVTRLTVNVLTDCDGSQGVVDLLDIDLNYFRPIVMERIVLWLIIRFDLLWNNYYI